MLFRRAHLLSSVSFDRPGASPGSRLSIVVGLGLRAASLEHGETAQSGDARHSVRGGSRGAALSSRGANGDRGARGEDSTAGETKARVLSSFGAVGEDKGEHTSSRPDAAPPWRRETESLAAEDSACSVGGRHRLVLL